MLLEDLVVGLGLGIYMEKGRWCVHVLLCVKGGIKLWGIGYG